MIVAIAAQLRLIVDSGVQTALEAVVLVHRLLFSAAARQLFPAASPAFSSCPRGVVMGEALSCSAGAAGTASRAGGQGRRTPSGGLPRGPVPLRLFAGGAWARDVPPERGQAVRAASLLRVQTRPRPPRL